jgi:hypothetical protein
MTLYPTGYGTRLVTLDELFRSHHLDRMHPEFARRLRRWLESQNGRIGIGGSWRATGTQPDKPGFAPEGKSFHQDQRFASGLVAFCAVDLVAVEPGKAHRSPRWSEVPESGSAGARVWGLHCNVRSEPWHMQPIEVGGYATWVRNGRPDPVAGYALPAAPAPTPETNPLAEIAAAISAAKATTIRRGSKGDAVKWLQIGLNNHAGEGLRVDGDFGTRTDAAVRRFQRSRGLTVDGIVGPRTWAALWP